MDYSSLIVTNGCLKSTQIIIIVTMEIIIMELFSKYIIHVLVHSNYSLFGVTKQPYGKCCEVLREVLIWIKFIYSNN